MKNRTLTLLFGLLSISALYFGAVSAQKAKAASFTYNIDSTREWQATSLRVSRGQVLSFSAVGSWSVDFRNFPFVGPEGYDPGTESKIYQGCKLDHATPYGLLLVRLGDDPNFELLGRGGQLVASYDGPVSFRIHDGDACLADNQGTATVTVTGDNLASSTPVPYFYCITSQVPTTQSGGVCQSAYTTPVPSWQQIPEPTVLKWLTSPNALDCLSSISFLSQLSIEYAPELRQVLKGSPELLKRLIGEVDDARAYLDVLTLAKSIFEKFYAKVTDAGIPLAPVREENEKRILLFLMQAAGESVRDVVLAQACRDAQSEVKETSAALHVKRIQPPAKSIRAK